MELKSKEVLSDADCFDEHGSDFGLTR